MSLARRIMANAAVSIALECERYATAYVHEYGTAMGNDGNSYTEAMRVTLDQLEILALGLIGEDTIRGCIESARRVAKL